MKYKPPVTEKDRRFMEAYEDFLDGKVPWSVVKKAVQDAFNEDIPEPVEALVTRFVEGLNLEKFLGGGRR
jgi:hypothetical protein